MSVSTGNVTLKLSNAQPSINKLSLILSYCKEKGLKTRMWWNRDLIVQVEKPSADDMDAFLDYMRMES